LTLVERRLLLFCDGRQDYFKDGETKGALHSAAANAWCCGIFLANAI
jgi:hypothetical protein